MFLWISSCFSHIQSSALVFSTDNHLPLREEGHRQNKPKPTFVHLVNYMLLNKDVWIGRRALCDDQHNTDCPPSAVVPTSASQWPLTQPGIHAQTLTRLGIWAQQLWNPIVAHFFFYPSITSFTQLNTEVAREKKSKGRVSAPTLLWNWQFFV